MAYEPPVKLPWYPTRWADSAPNAPAVPIPGTVYRKSNASATDMGRGQRFDQVYESSLNNQFYWAVHANMQISQQCGIPFWDNSSPYLNGALTVGRDGKVYQAQRDIPANNSVQPGTNEQYWSTPQFGGEGGLVDLSNYIEWTDQIHYYVVDPNNGNDNNDGLTSAKAKKTIAGALAAAGHFYYNQGTNINLTLMPGNYGQPYITGGSVPMNCTVVMNGQSSGVIFNGLTFSDSVSAVLLGQMSFNNAGGTAGLQVANRAVVQLGSTGNSGRAGRFYFTNSSANACVYVNTGGVFNVMKTDMEFNNSTAGSGCITVTNASSCEITNVGFYSGGNFGSVFRAVNSGSIYIGGPITCGTRAGASATVSDAVCYGWNNGSVYNVGTWTSGGTWTGKKAKAFVNGSVCSVPANPAIPGSGIEETKGGAVYNIT